MITQPCPAEWLKPKRGKSKPGKPGRHLPRGRVGNVITLDGEGMTKRANTKQNYVVLAASDGTDVQSKSYLSSKQCFDFILNLPKQALLASFYFDYDANMITRDLSLRAITELQKKGHTRWQGYEIRHVPHKELRIKRGKQSRTIWDTSGFFQCSFVAALKRWKVGTQEQVTRIESMKNQRGVFRESERPQILNYCHEECTLLTELVEKVIVTAESVGIRLRRFDGAGAIASSLMRQNQVKDYLVSPPEELTIPLLTAFNGGRFDTADSGEIGSGWEYDINSAYPYELQKLPCLACGTWRHSTRIKPSGLYRVSWSGTGRWGPLPFRFKTGNKCYPAMGETWAWGAEVKAAIKYWGGLGNQIEVLEGWVYETECDHRPFGFVPAIFAERQRLKAIDDCGELVLKLGMNAMAGKTMQSIGFRGNPPPFQSWVWAGMLTAGTRALILDAIAQDPDAVVTIATDGIITTRQLKLPLGPGLGEWTCEPATDIFIAQNGVYRYKSESKVKTKNRGFRARDFDWPAIRQEFAKNGPAGVCNYHSHTFVGRGAALQANPKLRDWLKWVDRTKQLKFKPVHRTIDLGSLAAPVLRTTALEDPEQAVSSPYKPKQTWEDPADAALAMELLGSLPSASARPTLTKREPVDDRAADRVSA